MNQLVAICIVAAILVVLGFDGDIPRVVAGVALLAAVAYIASFGYRSPGGP